MPKLSPNGTLSIVDLHTTYNFTPGKSSMRVGADYLMAKLSLYMKKEDNEGIQRARNLLSGMSDYFKRKGDT